MSVLFNGLAHAVGPVLAVVLLTVAVRLLITPLRLWQLRATATQRRLAPQLEDLRRRHARDPLALAKATTELYRAEGVNRFAGVLPALAQAPFLFVLYRLCLTATAGAVLGVPLGAHWFAGGPAVAVFGALAAVLILLAWWSSRRLRDQPTLVRLLPYGTAAALLFVPLAIAVYLVTTTAWTALETVVLRAG